jgi:small-conductance mechanosensitive channel
VDQELLVKLIGIVERVAPELWRIAMQQVTAQIVESIIWLGVFFCIGLFLGWFIPKLHKAYQDDEEPYGNIGLVLGLVFAYMGAVAALIGFFATTSQLVKLLIAPEYAALQVLLRLAG